MNADVAIVRPGSRRADDVLEDQVGALASRVARAAHSGATLRSALEEAAGAHSPRPGRDGLGEPLAAQVAAVVNAIRVGATVDEALRAWKGSAGSAAVDLFVAAARLGHTEGGQLAGAMDGVALALADRSELRSEARAQSAQARLSVKVLVALPVVGVVAFTLVEPQVVSTLFTTPIGLGCLVLGAGLDAAGALVASRIVERSLR